MKLYATTTSERASKGQGGNKYLDIEVKVIDRVEPQLKLAIVYIDDTTYYIRLSDPQDNKILYAQKRKINS